MPSIVRDFAPKGEETAISTNHTYNMEHICFALQTTQTVAY